MFINEAETTEKRRFRRVRFQEPVHYELKDHSRFGGCLGSDISEGGIKLSVNEFVPVDSEMVLQLKLANTASIVDVTGRVVWVQEVPYSDRYRIGLEFSEKDHLTKQGLSTYVQSRRF